MSATEFRKNGSQLSPALPFILSFVLPFVLPFVLLPILLLFAPNYQLVRVITGEQVPTFRTSPFGGDFLQDWVGGRMILDPDLRRRLYSPAESRQLQHDSELIGFEWPAEDYFPMVYPPYHYLLISPLAKLPYYAATIAWMVLLACSLAASGWFIHHSLPLPRSHAWPLMLAIVAFTPALISFSMGQKGSWMLLFFSASYYFLRKELPFLAGAVFGLVAIKPQFGIVIGLAMVLKWQPRFVAGAMTTIGGLVALSSILEPAWWRDYFRVIAGMRDYVSIEGYQTHQSHSLWGGLKLLLPDWLSGITFPLLLIGSLGVLFLIGVLDFGPWRSRSLQPNSRRWPFEFSQWVLASVLISPHCYTYDLTLLLLPMALTIGALSLRQSEGAERGLASPDVSFVSGGAASSQGVRGMAILTFCVAGLLPIMNLNTGFPWGVVLILSWIMVVRAHLKTMRD